MASSNEGWTPDASRALAAAVLENRARRLLGLGRREAVVAAAAAGGFAVVAAALALAGLGRPGPDPALTVALILLVAVLSTVEVELGPGVGVPTILGVVPMLVLLPPWSVPAGVGVAVLLGAAADVLVHRRAHPWRAIVPLGSCWFVLGPVAVLLASGGEPLAAEQWTLLCAALVAGVATDVASSGVAERAAYGTPLRALLPALAWCGVVDGLLGPVAFVVGVAALERPEVLAALVPAGGLVWLLGRERRRRVAAAVAAVRLEAEREDARASARDLAAILAWTRDASTTIGQSLNAVCGAACVVLHASAAALLEQDRAGWRLAASSGLPHGVAGRAVGDLAPPASAAEVEPLAVADLPPELRAVLDTEVERVLVWSVDGPDADERAALLVALPGDERVLGTRQRFALDVLGSEARTALERTAMLARLDELARRDALTGLPNRRHWEEELPRLLQWARTRSERLCIALLDLDRFKDYNDAQGHAAGDRLLRGAAAAWSSALRDQDLLARYGGEEFAIALPACSAEDAHATLDRLRAAMPDGQSCSAGLAVWDGAEPVARLLERADAALYAAKRGGRDQVVVAGPAG